MLIPRISSAFSSYREAATSYRDLRDETRLNQNNSSNMKNRVPQHVIGIPVSSSSYPVERSSKKLLSDPDLQHYIPPANSSSKFNKSKSPSLILWSISCLFIKLWMVK